MLLALSVISRQSQRLGAASYRVFDERGGSIGRGKQSDWVIDDPDQVLSGRHAAVHFTDGRFLIEDTSTNGTALNRADALLPKGQPVPINDGDHLYLGDFEILAQIIADAAPAEVEPAPAVPAWQPAEPAPRRAPPAAVGSWNPPPAPTPPWSAPPGAGLGDLLRDAPEPAPLVPPEPPPAYRTERRASGLSQPPPPPPPADTDAGPADLDALFAAIGVDPRLVPQETSAQLGTILRVVTQGLHDALVSRAEVKKQFRMSQTVLRPVENNPLKFREGEDALHTLFVKRNPGYLGPVEAFQEALDDLKRHQLGMLAGMQAAFAAVLQRFDPELIETDCDKSQGRGGLFSAVGKPRYWDFYREHYRKITHDSEATFQQVFGEAFVRAYDDQIHRLEHAAARQRR